MNAANIATVNAAKGVKEAYCNMQLTRLSSLES